MIKIPIICLFLFWTLASSACTSLLELPSEEEESFLANQAERLFSYLEDLINLGVVSDTALSKLQKNLESGEKLENPISTERALRNAGIMVHYEIWQNLVKADFDRGAFLHRLKEKNKIRVVEIQDRKVKQEKTANILEKIQLETLPAADFVYPDLVSDTSRKIRFSFMEDFRVMPKVLTQWQVATILPEYHPPFVPANAQDNEMASIRFADGRHVRMMPNHPATNLGGNEINSLLEKLNKLSDKDDPILYQLIDGHVRGAHYGLPNVAEWGYAVSSLARKWGLEIVWERPGFQQTVGASLAQLLKSERQQWDEDFYGLWGPLAEIAYTVSSPARRELVVRTFFDPKIKGRILIFYSQITELFSANIPRGYRLVQYLPSDLDLVWERRSER